MNALTRRERTGGDATQTKRMAADAVDSDDTRAPFDVSVLRSLGLGKGVGASEMRREGKGKERKGKGLVGFGSDASELFDVDLDWIQGRRVGD